MHLHLVRYPGEFTWTGTRALDSRDARVGGSFVRRSCLGRTIPAAGFAAAVLLPVSDARPQSITVDGRLSSPQTLAGPNYNIRAELGQQVGGNLFHSFGRFGLNPGETATFNASPNGAPSVNNVIGRVTGGATSSINGTIASSIPGANLYLINPAGVVFGPNARVDVNGSFHASSADYLRFQDGARFQATNPDASRLSAAPPEAFGFLPGSPRPVVLNGTQLEGPRGSTLSLVGGPVTIGGSTLSVPSGTVSIESAAGNTAVPINARNRPAIPQAQSGPVRLERSRVNVSNMSLGDAGGSVFIHAGILNVVASTISADNSSLSGGGTISLRGETEVSISDGAELNARTRFTQGANIAISSATNGRVIVDQATITSGTDGVGAGGQLSISTGDLVLRNGAVAMSYADDRGNGGLININVDSMLLDGRDTRLLSETTGRRLPGNAVTPVLVGAGGDIKIVGTRLTVQNRANIAALTSGDGTGGTIRAEVAGDLSVTGAASVGASTVGPFARGRGGDVSITSGGNLLIESSTADVASAQISQIVARSLASPGDAGTVDLRAQAISVRSGRISAETFGPGRAGAVRMSATGDFTIAGMPGSPVQLGVSADAAPASTGDAGSVRLAAGNLAIAERAVVSANGFGLGNAGSVTVETTSSAVLNSGLISTLTNGPGDAGQIAVQAGTLTIRDGGISTSTAGRGAAGGVRVQADSISLLDGGFINSSTSGSGRGGTVDVRAVGLLEIAGSSAQDRQSRITAQANALSTGDAGSVVIRAGNLAISRGGLISATTLGAGDAGEVTVDVSGNIAIDGGGVSAVARSGLPVATGINSQSDVGSTGRGGRVNVRAGSLTIMRNGMIGTSTFGSGAAGDVFIDVSEGAILIDGRNGGTRLTGIGSQAELGSAGPAGRVAVRSGSLVIANEGDITSATSGSGQGGDVSVNASDILLTGAGSRITALSTGTGNAGSITIGTAEVPVLRLRLRDGASISTEAREANGGNITLTVRDLLYLQRSSITTSVNGALGNGGNITIDPRFVVLDRSVIQANAVGGNGGNVMIRADQLVLSPDAEITASSQRGISGQILISGPLLSLGGTLTVLASELRAAAALLSESCAARGARPLSSLVMNGPGGQRQGVETSVPALYIANRPVRASEDDRLDASAVLPVETQVDLSAQCR